MSNSFMRISRDILDWGWYKDTNTFRVFFHLLINAQYKDGCFMGMSLSKGQLVTGRQILAKELGISEQSVRTALNHLKSTNEITIKPTNKYSVITVCRYDEWQCSGSEDNQQTNHLSNQQLTNNQPTTNQQLTTYNKDNKDNKEKKENITPLNPPTETSKKKVKFDVRADLSYVDGAYLDTWLEWLDYKDKINKQYKTDVGVRKQYKAWVNLSAGSIDKAKAIVDQSIMREYEGLFDVPGFDKKKTDDALKDYPFIGEDGKHYETKYEQVRMINSYEDYIASKARRR